MTSCLLNCGVDLCDKACVNTKQSAEKEAAILEHADETALKTLTVPEDSEAVDGESPTERAFEETESKQDSPVCSEKIALEKVTPRMNILATSLIETVLKREYKERAAGIYPRNFVPSTLSAEAACIEVNIDEATDIATEATKDVGKQFRSRKKDALGPTVNCTQYVSRCEVTVTADEGTVDVEIADSVRKISPGPRSLHSFLSANLDTAGMQSIRNTYSHASQHSVDNYELSFTPKETSDEGKSGPKVELDVDGNCIGPTIHLQDETNETNLGSNEHSTKTSHDKQERHKGIRSCKTDVRTWPHDPRI